MTGNWKANQGSAMLEQLPITEKYKSWIDEVSERFIEEKLLLMQFMAFLNNIIGDSCQVFELMREKLLLTQINLN